MKNKAFSAPHSFLLLGILLLLLLISGYVNIILFRGNDPLGIISLGAGVEASFRDDNIPGKYGNEQLFFLYSGCGHYDQDIPSDLENVDFSNYDWDNPSLSGWKVYRAEDKVFLEQLPVEISYDTPDFSGFCPECRKNKYIGLNEDNGTIAVFVGGKLVIDTGIRVDSADRDALEQHIPFNTTVEMEDTIESYSS